ncbi:MAG TPA: DUF1232 domain-containing protein [Chloroflexota bacterium]|nr:DUF1232 domain-containing protein [Chloroflexota bacterium]
MRSRRFQGHPLAKLGGTVARLPRYLKLANALARDPAVPALRKSALVGGIGYAILPFDLLPGIIPIVGQLDDLAALLLGIRVALGGCPTDTAQAHLARVGLADTAIDADLQTVRDAASWLARGAIRLGKRGALLPFRWLGGTVEK